MVLDDLLSSPGDSSLGDGVRPIESDDIASLTGDAMGQAPASDSLLTDIATDSPALSIVEDQDEGDADPTEIMDRFTSPDLNKRQLMVRVLLLPDYYEDNRTDTKTCRQFLRVLPVTDDLEETLRKRFGPGAYILEFRFAGVGKVERSCLFEIAPGDAVDVAPAVVAASAPAAAVVPTDAETLKSLKGAIGIVRELQTIAAPAAAAAPSVFDLLGQLKSHIGILKELGLVPDEKETTANGSTWPDIARDFVGVLRDLLPVAVGYLAAPGPGVPALPVGGVAALSPASKAPAGGVPAGPPVEVDWDDLGDGDQADEVAGLSDGEASQLVGVLSRQIVEAARANIPLAESAGTIRKALSDNPSLMPLARGMFDAPLEQVLMILPVVDESDRNIVGSYIQRLRDELKADFLASASVN